MGKPLDDIRPGLFVFKRKRLQNFTTPVRKIKKNARERIVCIADDAKGHPFYDENRLRPVCAQTVRAKVFAAARK